eukprot:jgi/Galph1/1051/GphlegSOOS_G5778.1
MVVTSGVGNGIFRKDLETEEQAVFDLFEQQLVAGSAYAPAAAYVLTEVIKSSHEETVMGLEVELKKAAEAILKAAPTTAYVSLKASTEMQRRLIERGEYFKGRTESSRDKIAEVGERFIQDGSVLLTHGNSRVVAAVLERAAKRKDFEFMSQKVVQVEVDIPLQKGFWLPVSWSRLYWMRLLQVDMVLVGAEGVAENGGIVNRIGSLQVALVAKAYNKPLFVAVESYKFSRLFPLRQRELPQSQNFYEPWQPLPPNLSVSSDIEFENPPSDFTSPKLITLLFTDLGVLTPAAVSDELIRLYQ